MAGVRGEVKLFEHRASQTMPTSSLLSRLVNPYATRRALRRSIFDNVAYVAPGPDVVTQLCGLLPASWNATLCAVDGAVVTNIEGQLSCVPAEATHLVLSVGGNDARSHVDLLERRAASAAEVLDQLAAMAEAFEQQYQQMLRRVLRLNLPLVVCTIYNGSLPDPALQRRAQTALMVFNDTILRSASAAGVSVIELRQVCREPEDYANPIEPSVVGGGKIAQAIRHQLLPRSRK